MGLDHTAALLRGLALTYPAHQVPVADGRNSCVLAVEILFELAVCASVQKCVYFCNGGGNLRAVLC